MRILKETAVKLFIIFSIFMGFSNINISQCYASDTKSLLETEEIPDSNVYIYVINLCSAGGNISYAASLCDEFAVNHPEYSHWANIKKAEIYILYAPFFNKPPAQILKEGLDIINKEIDYSKSKKDNKTLCVLYIRQGKAYYELKQYQKAVDSFNNAIHSDKINFSGFYDVYYTRGCSYALMGKYSKAMKDFKKISSNKKYSYIIEEDFYKKKEILSNLLKGETNVVFPEPSLLEYD